MKLFLLTDTDMEKILSTVKGISHDGQRKSVIETISSIVRDSEQKFDDFIGRWARETMKGVFADILSSCRENNNS